MEITIDGQLVTCTPEEYMELKRLGAFGDKPSVQGAAPKLGDGYDEWLKRGTMDVVAVYGCNMPGPLYSGDNSDASNKVGKTTRLSADTMSRLDAVVENNTPMLDGKYLFNPDTCTPGTETCGRCQRDEYCEKARMAKAAYEDRQRLAALPTIVRLSNPEIDPAGGYFHYYRLDADGKTYLNDNELEPWMVDTAISEQEFNARGSK